MGSNRSCKWALLLLTYYVPILNYFYSIHLKSKPDNTSQKAQIWERLLQIGLVPESRVLRERDWQTFHVLVAVVAPIVNAIVVGVVDDPVSTYTVHKNLFQRQIPLKVHVIKPTVL